MIKPTTEGHVERGEVEPTDRGSSYWYRVRYVERPGRWRLFRALLKGEYVTGWFPPK